MMKKILFSIALLFLTNNIFAQDLNLSDLTTVIKSINKGQKLLKAKNYSLEDLSQPDENMTSYLWKSTDKYVVDIGIGEFNNEVVVSTKEKPYANKFVEEALRSGYTITDQGSSTEDKLEWYKYKKDKYELAISTSPETYKVSLSLDKSVSDGR
jgi:hypothetical protein